MTMLIDGMTTLRRSGIVCTAPGILDNYRIVLDTNNNYLVYVERREIGGAWCDAFLYEGPSLDAANRVYSFYSGKVIE